MRTKLLEFQFRYPRKDSLETGDAANQLISSDAVPMDFVQPGGVAIAVVTLPTSVYPNGDLAAAFFNVSVNKTMTEEQCGKFSDAKPATPVDPEAPASATVQPSKLMVGDMELQSSETFSSQGTREETSKYYHVFENGACYEFALKVATTGSETERRQACGQQGSLSAAGEDSGYGEDQSYGNSGSDCEYASGYSSNAGTVGLDCERPRCLRRGLL